jgi:hypothetical protein
MTKILDIETGVYGPVKVFPTPASIALEGKANG